jgi:hypothetical protein
MQTNNGRDANWRHQLAADGENTWTQELTPLTGLGDQSCP